LKFSGFITHSEFILRYNIELNFTVERYQSNVTDNFTHNV